MHFEKAGLRHNADKGMDRARWTSTAAGRSDACRLLRKMSVATDVVLLGLSAQSVKDSVASRFELRAADLYRLLGDVRSYLCVAS